MKWASYRNLFIFLSKFPFFFNATEAQTARSDSSDIQRTTEMHRRWMEAAHPTPIIKSRRTPSPKDIFLASVARVPLLVQTGKSLFLDVNMIELETDQLPVQNESSIAVNPTNPKNLIASAVDYRAQSSTWVYVSQDGGKSWRNINLGKPFVDWTSSNDPSVSFAADGTGYLMHGGFGNRSVASPENGVFLARTKDEGKTWEAHIPVILHRGTQTPDSNFEDKYYVHTDNSPQSPYFGRVYTPWKRVLARDSSTTIVSSFSTDKGSTWSIPTRVSERLSGSSEDTTFGQSFPLIRTGPNGEAYCFWNFGPKHGIGFSTSNDGGSTWSAPRIIQQYSPLGVARQINEGVRHTLKGVVRVESYPTAICDLTNGPRRGWLYLAWAADSTPNIYFSRSTNAGATWSAPKIITETQKNDQFWPWIALDPTNGDVAIMYLDSRDYDDNIGTNCYVSYSSDGGDSWKDLRASDVMSDLRRNPFAGNNFAGDYSGCDFYNGIIFPSWVDMRNTAVNIADNDAYTSVMNLRIPRPPEPFLAKTLPASPTEIDVTWTPPKESALGKPLSDSEFKHILFRDNVKIAELPGSVASYRDKGLTPYTQYFYKILAATTADTSAPRESSAFAGGSRLPGKPLLLASQGSDGRTVRLSLRIPTLRSDSITPFVNPKSLIIYRDNQKVSESPISVDDTGKIVVITDTPAERGWYRYAVSIIDASNPANESAATPQIILYTGNVASVFTENFEASAKHYLTTDQWNITSKFGHSSANSLTNSRNNSYNSNARDTFTIYPALTSMLRELTFFHAAIVHPSDTCFLERSIDFGATWTRLGAYNSTGYAPWEAGELNAADWREEKIVLPIADTTIIRFRFSSNFRLNSIGWFIDDISIGAPTGVGQSTSHESIAIYPNPAQNYLVVRLEYDREFTVEITDMTGRIIELDRNSMRYADSHLTLNISALPNGVYGLKCSFEDGSRYATPFVIWR